MGRRSYSGRGVIEDTGRITLDDLRAWGFIPKGSGMTSGIITLSRNGEKSGNLGLTVRLNYPGNLAEGYFNLNGNFIDYRYQKGGSLEFDYKLNGEPVKYQYHLELFPCHFGVHRLFIRCRNCNRRVTALYLWRGYYSCRHCLRLVYQGSRGHRDPSNKMYLAHNLEARADRLQKNRYPRKANRLRERAAQLSYESLMDLGAWMKRKGWL